MEFHRAITAPDVPVDTKHCLVSRLYNAHTKDDEYGRYDTPPETVSNYGMIWSSPSRAANWFFFDPAPGQSGPKTATLDRLGRLAAHTVVLRPKYPDVVPDLDNLLPPNKRPVKKVWQTPDGAPAGEEPSPTSPYWEERPVVGWGGEGVNPPGSIVWYDGRAWITPDATGVPGESGSTWEVLAPAWDGGTTYAEGDTVVVGDVVYQRNASPDDGLSPEQSTSWDEVPNVTGRVIQTWQLEGDYQFYEIVYHEGVLYRRIGDSAGLVEPGTDPTVWEVVTPTTYSTGVDYAPGTVVEHNGILYTTPTATGQPGTAGSTWQPLEPWSPAATYPAGSTVTHGHQAPGFGLPYDPDKFQMGYPPGGDILPLSYRGVTVDPSNGGIWMVDGNNSFINLAGPDEAWTSWGVIGQINPNGHPEGLSPEGLSDWGYWVLRDTMWMDDHMWVIRQLDKHILKLSVVGVWAPIVGTDPVRYMVGGSVSIVDEIPIDTANPTALLSDGVNLYVQEVGSGTIEILDAGGTFQFAEAAPWGNDGVTGMAYDGGNYWTANPSTYEVLLWTPEGEVVDSRGWDADEEAPRSLYRHANWLYVITATWLYRFPIGGEKGILRWTGEKWVCQPVYRWTGTAWIRTNIWRLDENGVWVDAEVPCINPHE